MANTFKKIQTVTVGSGGAATIDFTSIPQTYTDLKLVVSARGTATFASSGNYYVIKPNGLNTNLSGKYLISIGTSVATGSFQPFGYMSASDYTANTFGNGEHYISNYTSANYKSFSSNDTAETNASIMYAVDINAGLWSSTDAITSLTLTPGGGNFAQYTTATLYGVANVPAAGNAKATGGIITYDDTYVYHAFPWSGTFTPLTSLSVDYLVVAGGGGGGGRGGGGAGGLRCTVGATGGGGSLETPLSLTTTAYTVTIGAGGVGAINTGSPVNAASGTNSVFGSITSTGGGNGAGDSNYTQAAGNGGSGGGASATSGTAANAGTGTSNQGFAGGTTSGGSGGGGGGGAGAVGSNGSANTGANGGAGVASSISGTSVTRAGGGGGGGNSTGGTGGAGGGGNGVIGGAGNAGTVNTGSGGGGTTGTQSPTAAIAGNGGSGIVIVRYAR